MVTTTLVFFLSLSSPSKIWCMLSGGWSATFELLPLIRIFSFLPPFISGQVNNVNPCHGHYTDPVALCGAHGTTAAVHGRLANRSHGLLSVVAAVSVQLTETDETQLENVLEVMMLRWRRRRRKRFRLAEVAQNLSSHCNYMIEGVLIVPPFVLPSCHGVLLAIPALLN